MLTRRVVLYDLRGHGGSPLGADADGSLAQLGADLIHVLDDAGVERAVIAGFSLGGTIAMRAAIDAPERVSALALIGTSSRVNTAARGWYEERAAMPGGATPGRGRPPAPAPGEASANDPRGPRAGRRT